MATNYSRGADFERRVARQLGDYSYKTVRSAGSHSPTDIIALRRGIAVAVQCKRSGRLYPDEWNEFFDWCAEAGAVPVVAMLGKNGKGAVYQRITGRKGGAGRQPWVPWVPERKGNDHEVQEPQR